MTKSITPVFNRPANLAELASCLKLHKEFPESSYIVAGCTDFLAKRNGKAWSWDVLTDITAITELKSIDLIECGAAGSGTGRISGGLPCRAAGEAAEISGGLPCRAAGETAEISGGLPCRAAETVLRIGAACTHAQIAEDSIVNKRFKALALACSQIGSPQVRNRGTIGGNAANASPAADTLPVLMVFGAKAVALNSAGEYRRLTMDELIAGPGKNALKPDEAIVAFELPVFCCEAVNPDSPECCESTNPADPNCHETATSAGKNTCESIESAETASSASECCKSLNPAGIENCGASEPVSAFAKLGDRIVVTIAKISLALAAEKQDGKLQNVRICIGAAGAKPFLSEASAVLEGKNLADFDGITPNKTLLESLAAALGEDIRRSIPGRASMPYKKRAVKGLAADLLAQLKD